MSIISGYDHIFSQGNRLTGSGGNGFLVAITQSSALTSHISAPWTEAFKGNYGGGPGYFSFSPTTADFIDFQFSEATIIDGLQFWGGDVTDYGTWQFSGSNDGSTYTSIDSPFHWNITNGALPGSSRGLEVLFTNTTAYLYYRFTYVSGSFGGNKCCEELVLRIPHSDLGGGVRSGLVTVTAGPTNLAPRNARTVSDFVDGLYTKGHPTAGADQVSLTAPAANDSMAFNFGASVAILRWKLNNDTQFGNTYGTWQWEGSNNGSTWTASGSSFSFSGSGDRDPIYSVEVPDPADFYKQWRIKYVSGSTNGLNGMYEFVFDLDEAVVSPVGDLITTDTPDVMVSAGFVPPSGSMATTEHGDSWATSPGFERLGIESVHTNYDGSAFSTLGPDRIVILLFGAPSPNPMTSLTDAKGLTWKTEFQITAGPDQNGTDMVMQMWWAYAHDKLINDTLTSDPGFQSGSSTQWIIFAVKGLNGNYNQPWDYSNDHAFGANIGALFGSPTEPQCFGVSTGPGDGSPYPSMLLTAAMSTVGSGFASLGIPVDFTSIANHPASGVARNTTLMIAQSVQETAIPPSPSFDLSLGGADESWLMLYDTLVCGAPNPGSWESIESQDTAQGLGYTGAFGVIGFMDAHETADHAIILGFQRDSGIFVTNETRDVFSAYGFQPLTGVLTATGAADHFVAHGIGVGEDGVFITTEAVDIFAASGNTPISGPWNSTEAPDRFLALGAGVTQVSSRSSFFVT